MRYLVTGGFGYMGSWAVELLTRQGHDVFVLSRSGQKGSGAQDCAFIQADLATISPQDLASILPKGLHGCLHIASFNEAFAPGYAQKSLLVNGLGTRTLAQALVFKAQQEHISLPVLVYCSTFHVYGASCGHITENTPAAPQNDYALTHLVGEEYCRMFLRTQGLPCIIVRPTNGYGAPRQSPFGKWYLLFNDLCRMAFTQGKITLRSSPKTLRDFVWMGDVVATLAGLLSHPEYAGSIFNIASGQAVSIGEVARLVADTATRFLGKEIPLVCMQAIGAENPPPLVVDNSALRAVLGFTPTNKMQEEMWQIFEFLALHGEQ